jgi:hypothetical protein
MHKGDERDAALRGIPRGEVRATYINSRGIDSEDDTALLQELLLL